MFSSLSRFTLVYIDQRRFLMISRFHRLFQTERRMIRLDKGLAQLAGMYLTESPSTQLCSRLECVLCNFLFNPLSLTFHISFLFSLSSPTDLQDTEKIPSSIGSDGGFRVKALSTMECVDEFVSLFTPGFLLLVAKRSTAVLPCRTYILPS